MTIKIPYLSIHFYAEMPCRLVALGMSKFVWRDFFMAKNKKRWLLLFVICLGGGIIYILPYLQYSFYDVMQADFGISNEQMGNLMSVYGLLNLLGYLFGGIVADRISYKALIPVSINESR